MSLTLELGADVEASPPKGNTERLGAVRAHEDLHEATGTPQDVLDSDVFGVDAFIPCRGKKTRELARCIGQHDGNALI